MDSPARCLSKCSNLDSRGKSLYSFSFGPSYVNIAVTPTWIHRTPSASRKPLAIVYIVMATLALALAAALEVGGLRSPDIADAGAVPFILAAITGALAAWVASLGSGVVGGALTGFAYAFGGGIVQAFSRGADMPLPAILAALLLMTILGLVLGALGALPVAFARWRRTRSIPRYQ